MPRHSSYLHDIKGNITRAGDGLTLQVMARNIFSALCAASMLGQKKTRQKDD